jgi:hypothetical protein
MNSISILESEQGKAKVAYDFAGFKMNLLYIGLTGTFFIFNKY